MGFFFGLFFYEFCRPTGGCFILKTGGRDLFFFTMVSEKESKGRAEDSLKQNEILISPCFERGDTKGEGFIAAWPPLLHISVYQYSCSPPAWLFHCLHILYLSSRKSDVSCGLQITVEYVAAIFFFASLLHSESTEGCLEIFFVLVAIVLLLIIVHTKIIC